MAIDQCETGAPDGEHIDLSEPIVIQAWCSNLVCTEAELRDAVGFVGPDAAKVTAYLDARRWQAKRRGPMVDPPPGFTCDSL